MSRAASSVAASVCLAVLVVLPGVPRSSLAGTAGVGSGETIAARNGKAGTMAELARMYDSGPCAECHRAVFDQWRSSAHAMSVFGGGRTAAALRSALVEGLMQWQYSGVKGDNDVTVGHLMGCAKCHLPQLADAGDGAARELAGTLSAWRSALDNNDQAAAGQAAEKLKALNIGCLICHNRNAVIHKWTDGYPGAGEVYGSKAGPHGGNGFTTLKKSPIMGESILCGQCHGLGPNLELENPTQCSSVYGSYLYTYRAQGGTQTCQDCHMRRNRLGHAARPRTDAALAAEALDFAADARGFLWRDRTRLLPRVAVDVSMTNKAGHSLPGSGSNQKRLVLEVTAKTAGGAEAYKGSRAYTAIAQRLGRGGRTGGGPYERTGIVEDTALPAGRTVRERFDIVLEPPEPGAAKDGGAPLEVTVTVKLRLVDEGAPARDATWFESAKVVKFEDVK